MWRSSAAALVGAIALAADAPAQQRVPLGALDSLAAAAAEHSMRYADRRVAIAEGYRRLGADFPGMGEHWLHSGVLLSGRVDPRRPTLLAYASVNGRPSLLGVGFIALSRGDSAVHAPGWPAVWHEHSGLLDHESGAGADGRARGHPTPVRVWVLHVWTELENPAGPYAADNWHLPLLRAGVRPGAPLDADAGRAASLAVGGDTFLRDVLTAAGLRTEPVAERVDRAIAIAASRAATTLEAARAAGALEAPHAARLRTVWAELGVTLRAAVGDAVDPYLAPPHGGVASSPHEHRGHP